MTFVFDCDSTLIRSESLEELARIALRERADGADVLARMQEITNLGMCGKMAFDESLRRRLELFGATREHIRELQACLLDQLTPSLRRHTGWFKQNSQDIYVLTGGFHDYLSSVLDRLGVRQQHVFANCFTYEGEKISGFDESCLVSQPGGKVKQLASLRLPRPIIMVGDGSTDAEVKLQGEADAFWVLTENVSRPAVIAQADEVLCSFDDFIRLSSAVV